MSQIGIDIFYQRPVDSSASGFFKALASGYANVWFDEEYIADVDSEAHPAYALTNLWFRNKSDRDIYIVSLDAVYHLGPYDLSADGDFLTNQAGTAVETYNSCYLRLIPRSGYDAIFSKAKMREVKAWDAIHVGSSQVTFGDGDGEFPRNWARNTFNDVSSALQIPTYRDFDSDSPNMVVNGEFDGGMSGWTDESGGKASYVASSGVKILAGGSADPDCIHPYLYGIFQKWEGTRREDLTGRWMRYRANWEDEGGSPTLSLFASSGVSSPTAAVSSAYLQERHWWGNSHVVTSGFEYNETPSDPNTWYPLTSSGYMPGTHASGTKIRFTSQDVMQRSRYSARLRQLDYTNDSTYHGHINLATSDVVVWADETPTFGPWLPEDSVTGDTQHFYIEFFDKNTEWEAYKLSFAKTLPSAYMHYWIDEPIVGTVASGDLFMYKAMFDTLTVDPSGFYATVRFTDSTVASGIPRMDATKPHHWQHIEISLDDYVGKAISGIELRYDSVDSGASGFCEAWFNHIQLVQRLQKFNGRQFRLECEMMASGITSVETWSEAQSNNHAFGGTNGQYTNGEGFLMVLVRHRYSPSVYADYYAYIDTGQLDAEDTWQSFYQWVGLPSNGQTEFVGLFAGFWGSNTANNGGYMYVRNIGFHPNCDVHAACVHTLDEGTGSNPYQFRTVDQYGAKAWAIQWSGTWYQEE